VLLDICGIVFSSPYLFDRKFVFYQEENKYHLLKMGLNILSELIASKLMFL
jgi:hypothetical protein